MKSITVCLLLITGLCLFACMPALAAADGTTTDLSTFMIPLEPAGGSAHSATVQAAASGDSYPITVKQAKDAIRTFAGSTDMDLVLSRTGTMPVGSYYLFGQTNSSSYYYVNQNSGVVEFALLAENIPDNGNILPDPGRVLCTGNGVCRFPVRDLQPEELEDHPGRAAQYLVVPHEWY